MKYTLFLFIALMMMGSLTPIAHVAARGDNDDRYEDESHDRYDEDEDEDEDDDYDEKRSISTTSAANLSTDARMKLLQELLNQLIALLNQIKSGSPVSTPVTPAASSTATSYTAATVAIHNTKASCWSIVNSKVYDLTSYISRHPGGSQSIASICGKDGTSAFTGQHGGDSKPEAILSGYYLAPLTR